MCQPIIQGISFDQASYGKGALMTATVNFTACCSGPFTFSASDTDSLTWAQSNTDGITIVQFQANAVSQGTFTFTATITSEDGLSDSQSWPFTVTGTSASVGLVGATVNPNVYGLAGSQTVQAAKQLDGFLAPGVVPAMTRQKQFWNEGVFSATDPGLLNLLNNGVKVQISVKPTRTSNAATIASQQSALSSAVTSVLAVSTNVEWNLWQEMNDGTSFPSGGVTYPQYWTNYAPTIVSAGGVVIFDPGCNGTGSNYANAVSYFPALSPVPHAFYCDWYANAFRTGTFPDQVPAGVSTSYMALADGAGIPFGLGEWGFGQLANVTTLTLQDKQLIWGSPIPFTDSTGGQWSGSYMSYMMSLFKARLKAGKNNADICGFFSGITSPLGSIQSSTDFKTGNLVVNGVLSNGQTVNNVRILGLIDVWNAGI